MELEVANQVFYSNGIEVSISPYDINLRFQRHIPPPGGMQGVDLQPQTIAELTVIMSPAHAKAMLSALYSSVLSYENAVGSIALPIDMQETFDRTFNQPTYK